MDITLGTFFALCLGAFYLWQNKRNEERAVVARERIKNDTILYKNIRTALREYNWKCDNDSDFFIRFFTDAKDRELLLDTAHFSIYKVDHTPEFRLGFYFKDINQYGLYGQFEEFESYYRTDKTFQEEGRLVYDEE